MPLTRMPVRGMAGPVESTDTVCIIDDLSKSIAGRTLFRDLSLSFFHGAKIGILGPNGAGKSTLMKIIAGLDKDFDGSVWLRDGFKVGFLEQEPELDPTKDVGGNVFDGVKHKLDLVHRFNEVSHLMADPDQDMDKLMEEQAALMDQIETLNAWNVEHEVEIAMDALRCPPPDAEVSVLSGGEKRRVAIARLLLSQPDMLLLDEPTNHLDAESVAWLEHYLREYSGCVMMVTHDRYFLDNVTGWMLELDGGQAYPYKGNYSSWLAQKMDRLSKSQARKDAKSKALEAELDWLRRNPKGGTSRQRAREQRAEGMQKAMKEDAAAERLLSGAIVIPPGPRLGDKVISARGLTKAFDGRVLFDNFSLNVDGGDRIGIIGGNGTGKSTLFRIIAGDLAPDAGRVDIGTTVKMGVVTQSRFDMKDDNVVYEEIAQGEHMIRVGGRELNVRAYTAAFNIKGSAQEKLVGDLSGGERNRVHLAKTLKSGVNVLLLDEPTNDLDVDTLRSLEEAVSSFEGAVVIISHDRYFLDRVCNKIIAFEGDSNVVVFDGSYSEYEAEKKRLLGDSYQPHRIQFKRLKA